MALNIFYYDWTKDNNHIFQDYKFKKQEFLIDTSITKNDLFNYLLDKANNVFKYFNVQDVKFLEIPSINDFYCKRGGSYLNYFDGQPKSEELLNIKPNTNIMVFYHHSQHNEDSIISAILNKISIDKKFVDIGSKDGKFISNIYLLRKQGYKGIGFDVNLEGGENDNSITFIKKMVTPCNIISLFKEYNLPKDFDFCNIDIDGNDIHLLESMLQEYEPKLICIEADARNDKWRRYHKSKYNENYKPKDVLESQASIIALNDVLKNKYKCVYNNTGNVFFVHEKYISNFDKISNTELKHFITSSLDYYNKDLQIIINNTDYLPGCPYNNCDLRYHPKQRILELIEYFNMNNNEFEKLDFNYPFIPMYKLF
jgi:hypothetical protein